MLRSKIDTLHSEHEAVALATQTMGGPYARKGVATTPEMMVRRGIPGCCIGRRQGVPRPALPGVGATTEEEAHPHCTGPTRARAPLQVPKAALDPVASSTIASGRCRHPRASASAAGQVPHPTSTCTGQPAARMDTHLLRVHGQQGGGVSPVV